MKYRIAVAKSKTLPRAKRSLSEEVNEFVQEEGYRPHGDFQLAVEEVSKESDKFVELQYVLAQPMVKDES